MQVPYRAGHAHVVHGSDSIVIFGGEDNTGRLWNDVQSLDVKTLTWHTLHTGTGLMKLMRVAGRRHN
jgi:hypothetical protein